MFFGKKKRVRLTEEDLRSHVLVAMYMLSDGLEWHIAGEEKDSHPVVMASPEEIADIVCETIFQNPSSGEEDSSASS